MHKLLPFLLLLPGLAPAQGRDTVLAVHKLFAQKRASGEGIAAGGATVGAGAAVGNPLYTAPQVTGADVATTAVAGVIPTALGLLQLGRFSPQREAEVLKLYAEGWGLPPDIRRKLRRKHFRRTADDVRAGR